MDKVRGFLTAAHRTWTGSKIIWRGGRNKIIFSAATSTAKHPVCSGRLKEAAICQILS